jgi:hypothetical protein
MEAFVRARIQNMTVHPSRLVILNHIVQVHVCCSARKCVHGRTVTPSHAYLLLHDVSAHMIRLDHADTRLHTRAPSDIHIARQLAHLASQKGNRTRLLRLRLTTTATTTTSNAGIKDKDEELASRSKAARDFGTAWRAGMAAVVPPAVPGREEEEGRLWRNNKSCTLVTCMGWCMSRWYDMQCWRHDFWRCLVHVGIDSNIQLLQR